MVACDNTECTYQWVGSFRINIHSFLLTFVFRVSSPMRQPQTATAGGVVLF
jgi:hypothetical protein